MTSKSGPTATVSDSADGEGILRDRLHERLVALHRTPRSVSIEAGLSPDALRMILSGRSKSPRGETLAALANVLRCDVNYLLGTGAPPRDPAPHSPPETADTDRDLLKRCFDRIETALDAAIATRLEDNLGLPKNIESVESTFSVKTLLARDLDIISNVENRQLQLLDMLRRDYVFGTDDMFLHRSEVRREFSTIIPTLRSDAQYQAREAVEIWAVLFSSIVQHPDRVHAIEELRELAHETLAEIEPIANPSADKKNAY